MGVLHITPGLSAGGSLIGALREAGRNDEVLPFRDDLSCGPIEPGDPAGRADWWRSFYEILDLEAALKEFWDRATSTHDHLVVWFGRHSALELAFFLAWVDRLGDRTYDIVDVTGRRLPFRARDGSVTSSEPAVSIVQSQALQLLFGEERPITAQERERSKAEWQKLRGENAPFRVVTETGLVSAAIDHFDPLLLGEATNDWQSAARVAGNTMLHNSQPYCQVGDMMLQARLAALVEAGKLEVDGDPWRYSSRVRLPT